MENASKALLMAASILIGVLLLSFMAYMFLFMSNYAGTVQENLYAKETHEFNAQFQVYDKRSDLTIQDVKSIVNLVNNYNSKFDNEENNVQAIKMNFLGITNKKNIEQKVNEILENTLGASLAKIYTCSLGQTDGKVSKVTITEAK